LQIRLIKDSTDKDADNDDDDDDDDDARGIIMRFTKAFLRKCEIFRK
jgi:hypothetical protein